MGMRARIKARRENRKLRKQGPEKTYYGRTKEQESKYREEYDRDVGRERTQNDEARGEVSKELASTRQATSDAGNDYGTARSDANWSRGAYNDSIEGLSGQAQNAMAIRNNVLGQNQLTGSAESILAQRQAQLAGVPTIGQATNTAIGQNYANAQAALNNAIGKQGRQARGLAGSMGEGGALAMQQAMASQGANAADLMAQNQTQQNQLASQLRFNAAMAQNQQDIDSANLGVDLRMGAAEQERQAALGFADANAGMSYDASLQALGARNALMGQDAATRENMGARQLELMGAGHGLATAGAGLAQNALGMQYQNRQNLEGTAAGVSQQDNMAKYQAAVDQSPMNKLKRMKGVLNLGSPGTSLMGDKTVE